jgi:hypothetical protein
VYLAYLDDSEVTRAKVKRWQVLAAVIVPDTLFSLVEFMASMTIESLMPEDRRDQFEEFHASELYNGHKIFDGIDQSKRFDAINQLLQVVPTFGVTVAYGAIDLVKLGRCSYRSANPLDMAFRLCTQGVHQWLLQNALDSIAKADNDAPSALAMFIADGGDKKDDNDLQRSFRELRQRMRPPDYNGGDLALIHDDMYFGDSKYSIGIQLADLCGFFIGKHLENLIEGAVPDPAAEGFYDVFKDKIIYSRIEPE